MKKKRLLGILLCMTLVLTGFAGCGKNEASAKAETETETEKDTEEKDYINSTEFIVADDTESINTETTESEITESETTEVGSEEAGNDTPTNTNTDTTTDDSDSTTTSGVTVQPVEGAEYSNVTLIGDSVMLGAAENISSAMPGCVVDAKESRQVRAGVEIAQALEQQGNLRSTVVIALGTNGTFSTETGQALIDYLGPDRNIYWVYAYGVSWQQDSNNTISALATNNANVTIIDWPAYASGHSEYFYSDGIHLNSDGRNAYAQMLVDNVH